MLRRARRFDSFGGARTVRAQHGLDRVIRNATLFVHAGFQPRMDD
jgi:hypothetical protein